MEFAMQARLLNSTFSLDAGLGTRPCITRDSSAIESATPSAFDCGPQRPPRTPIRHASPRATRIRSDLLILAQFLLRCSAAIGQTRSRMCASSDVCPEPPILG